MKHLVTTALSGALFTGPAVWALLRYVFHTDMRGVQSWLRGAGAGYLCCVLVMGFVLHDSYDELLVSYISSVTAILVMNRLTNPVEKNSGPTNPTTTPAA